MPAHGHSHGHRKACVPPPLCLVTERYYVRLVASRLSRFELAINILTLHVEGRMRATELLLVQFAIRL